MTKARKYAPEDGSIDPQLWLAQVLRVRFDKIVELYSAPLEPPRAEGVHDMRVAIRRLRSAVRDFAYLTDKFRLKKIRRKLKSLASLLGAVRDLDVAINAFTKASKIADDQLFYCRQRGLSEEDAVNLIVNGFCKDVLKELPMEFAVEAQKLLGISLEGSVG